MPRGKCPSGGRQAGHIVPTLPRWPLLHHTVLREVKSRSSRRKVQESHFGISWIISRHSKKAAFIDVCPHDEAASVSVFISTVGQKSKRGVKGATHIDKTTENDSTVQFPSALRVYFLVNPKYVPIPLTMFNSVMCHTRQQGNVRTA